MTLAPFVQTLGRGPGRARSLTQDEAFDAMTVMLSGKAAPEAVGAILMLMRMKGETAEEIAGFAQASQHALPALPPADLDWPSYAAGRTRGLPWFLLSARLVAQAGHRVVLHGWQTADGVRSGLPDAGIAVAQNSDAAQTALAARRIVYVPLEHVHPALLKLLQLRNVLGLRSCVNTVCRMLNPARAPASVQGVFHPSYRLLQADAALIMGWRRLSVIKGGGGEFERNPGKEVVGFGVSDGRLIERSYPALYPDARRLSESVVATDIGAVWRGVVCDEAAARIVVGTAALALETLGHPQPDELAAELWAGRDITQKETAA